MNPADYFIHVVDENIDALVEQQEASKKLSLDVEVPVVGDADGGEIPKMDAAEEEAAGGEDPLEPVWYQIQVLATRNLRTYVRNPVYLISETSQYAFMGLFVGLMYLQLSNSVETGVSGPHRFRLVRHGGPFVHAVVFCRRGMGQGPGGPPSGVGAGHVQRTELVHRA
jgi:hypothetical protein